MKRKRKEGREGPLGSAVEFYVQQPILVISAFWWRQEDQRRIHSYLVQTIEFSVSLGYIRCVSKKHIITIKSK